MAGNKKKMCLIPGLVHGFTFATLGWPNENKNLESFTQQMIW